MSRRDFLKRTLKSFFLAISLAAFSAIAYIYPSKLKQRKLHYIFLLDEADLPKRGVQKVEFEYVSDAQKIIGIAYLVADEKGVIAFSPVCTHLGCLVNWAHNKKEFICPCHGGRYAINGNVIAGPPPRSLTKLPLEIKDGKVYVGVEI